MTSTITACAFAPALPSVKTAHTGCLNGSKYPSPAGSIEPAGLPDKVKISQCLFAANGHWLIIVSVDLKKPALAGFSVLLESGARLAVLPRQASADQLGCRHCGRLNPIAGLAAIGPDYSPLQACASEGNSFG